MMVHYLRVLLLEHLRKRLFPDVGPIECGLRMHILPLSRGEIVHHHHRVTRSYVFIHYMGSNESSSTRYQDLHAASRVYSSKRLISSAAAEWVSAPTEIRFT